MLYEMMETILIPQKGKVTQIETTHVFLFAQWKRCLLYYIPQSYIFSFPFFCSTLEKGGKTMIYIKKS